jgi:hypothetical protein
MPDLGITASQPAKLRDRKMPRILTPLFMAVKNLFPLQEIQDNFS